MHFWPTWTVVQGLRIDYLSPTLYLSYFFLLIFLGSVLILSGHPERSEGRRFFGLRPQNDKGQALFLALLATLSLSISFSNRPQVALLKLDQLLLAVALGVSVVKVGRRLTWGWLGLPLALSWTSLLAIFQFLTQHSLGLWVLGERSISIITPGIATSSFFGTESLRPYATFSHPNSLAGFVLVGAFMVLALRHRYPLWLTTLSVSLSAVAIFLSGSRSATVAGLFLLSLAVLWRFLSQGLIIRLSLAAFLIALTLTLTLTDFRPADQSLARRSEQIRFSLETLRGSPVFGIGLNNFIPALGQTLPSPKFPNLSSPTLWLQPVHNVFLLILVETDLLGFAILIFFLWKSFRRLYLDIDLPRRPACRQAWQAGLNLNLNLNYYLPLSLLGILFTSLADHYWFTLIQNQLLAAIVFGLIWSKQS